MDWSGTGTPSIAIRSLNWCICGEVDLPTLSPFAMAKRSRYSQVEPFPFVPATRIVVTAGCSSFSRRPTSLTLFNPRSQPTGCTSWMYESQWSRDSVWSVNGCPEFTNKLAYLVIQFLKVTFVLCHQFDDSRTYHSAISYLHNCPRTWAILYAETYHDG